MRLIIAAILLGIYSGTAWAQEATFLDPVANIDPWDGKGPPAIGTIKGQGDGDQITWTTFDFSVGAFDSSAWATFDNHGHGPETLSIMGYTASDSLKGRILFRTLLPAYETGIFPTEVLLIDDEIDKPRQMGLATMTVTKFDRDAPDASYGDFKARVEGTLCATQDPTDCFSATFDITTELQFGT